VQQQVRVVRRQLPTLNEIITYVMTRPPQPINDTEYLDQLMAVNETVNQLWQNASVHGNISASFSPRRFLLMSNLFTLGVFWENKSRLFSARNSEFL